MTAKLRAAICGFGRIAAGYADDPLTKKYYRYSTHVQVLAEHPAFHLEAIADVSDTARRIAIDRWGVTKVFASVDEMVDACRPEVLVVATPASARGILSEWPGLRGILMEKPLGLTLEDSSMVVRHFLERGILVQVNLWRRADAVMRKLSGGGLKNDIGEIQAGFGIYGNGLLNNGVHMIDLVRMLAGEVMEVRALASETTSDAGSVSGDVLVPFNLRMASGFDCGFYPVRFMNYRENSLDLWGTRGRIMIGNEGLVIRLWRRAANRAIQGEYEIPFDAPEQIESAAGTALYDMYSNLAEAIWSGAPLCSPAESALKSEHICHLVRKSAHHEGKVIHVIEDKPECRP
jgi:predicted dehydrogenase